MTIVKIVKKQNKKILFHVITVSFSSILHAIRTDDYSKHKTANLETSRATSVDRNWTGIRLNDLIVSKHVVQGKVGRRSGFVCSFR